MLKKTVYTKKYFLVRDCLPQTFSHSLLFFLKEKGIKRVLDVGCGTGLLVAYLNQNGIKATGCDISEEALKIARKRNRKDCFVKASAVNLPFKKASFDMVLAVSVIEHLTKQENQKFLGEVRRVLKHQGFYYVVSPNLLCPLRPYLGKRWCGIADPSHVTLYTPFSYIALLKKQGFNKFNYWFKIPRNLPFDWWFAGYLKNLPAFMKYFVSFLLISTPAALLRESFFICAGKSESYET